MKILLGLVLFCFPQSILSADQEQGLFFSMEEISKIENGFKKLTEMVEQQRKEIEMLKIKLGCA